MFTPNQRLLISKKIISAPDDKASLDKAIVSLQEDKANNIILDSANKTLMDIPTPSINSYQSEIGTIDGDGRNQLLESHLIDSSKRKAGNFFFPNNQSTPTPSIPSGVWINIPPFLLNVAIGKNYTEGYSAIALNEEFYISDVISKIQSFLATYTNEMERVTGQMGILAPDSVIIHTALRAALSALATSVDSLELILQSEYAFVNTNPDTDSGMVANNLTAKNNINTALAAIAAWKAYVDYNTSHGQTTYAGFYAYNASLLYPTKGQQSNLNTLLAAMQSRQSFLPGRKSQITTRLGAVSQNLTNGDITSTSGLYGDRAKAISLRLDLSNGTLVKVSLADIKISAVEQQKKAIDNYIAAYTQLMDATILESVSNGTGYVNITESLTFAVGDKVYLVSDTQEEIEAQIQEVSGKRILLSKAIPPKYRPSEFARLIKEK